MILIPPSLVLGFVLASLYGLVFYLLFGHGWVRLGAYWLAGIVGFALGEWLGRTMGWGVLRVGPLNALEGTLVSWASLVVVWVLRR